MTKIADSKIADAMFYFAVLAMPMSAEGGQGIGKTVLDEAVRLGYAKVKDGTLIVTGKGKAFARQYKTAKRAEARAR